MSTTRRRRPALVVLVILAALTCLALGWWQWERYESASGTGQNLGYALQWPVFAGFFIYAYRKFVRYEDEPPSAHDPNRVTEIPTGLLPERPKPEAPEAANDPALAEYNAYLAQLSQADKRQDRTNS
jgi:DNA-binding transcriptional regulator of glucitol operon